MRRHAILLFCLLSILSLQAQNSAGRQKMTLAAQKQLREATLTPGRYFIKGNEHTLEATIQKNGGTILYRSGDIAAVQIDANGLQALQEEKDIYLIDGPVARLNLLNDVMVHHNNVDSAYYGYWPLDMAYDGSGVVIGIIDAPFDILHGDFTDAEGNSRIKYVWDQNLSTGTPPAPFDYGIECDSAMIANGTCPSNDFDEQNYSHGSGVAGVAASSGNASHHYRGVAPNADLILVPLDFEYTGGNALLDAIAYIYAKADAMGKPCVINTSLGDYAGSHDGLDLQAQAIDNMISEHPGRSLVAAAGNAGNFPFHLSYSVSGTEQFTWFKKLSYTNAAYFELWADTADFQSVSFRISADNPGAAFATVGSTPWYTVPVDFDLTDAITDSISYVIPGAGTVNIYIELTEGRYLLQFDITPSVSSFYWRFGTMGSGSFDIWAAEATTGMSNFVTSGLPDAGTLPSIVNYRLPDTQKSIVSSWQCSDKVITVGSYVNRDTMTNYYGEMPLLIDEVGALFYSSSLGPTRDNRIKPDICAPGARILSTEASILSAWLIDLGAANYMAQDGMHYLYNGTSFSSPAVAGIVALYMQKNPDADYQEIKDALLSQARHDAFTGEALPNNAWGYGKADAFRMLTGPWGCGADDHADAPQNVELIHVLPDKAQIGWDLIPNAAGYQVSYKAYGGVANKVKTTTNSKNLMGLTPNTTYSAKVRAFCSAYGYSNWSAPLVFTTPPMRLDAAQNATQVFPVPARNTLYIHTADNMAQFEIMDLLEKRSKRAHWTEWMPQWILQISLPVCISSCCAVKKKYIRKK